MSKMKTEGFTLVEVMIVLVILGIIASIGVPAFTGYIDNQREKDAIHDCRMVVAAAQSQFMNRYVKNTSELTQLNVKFYKEIIADAGVDGEIKVPVNESYTAKNAVEFNDTDEKISRLYYEAKNGYKVKYDASESEQYSIYHGDLKSIMDDAEESEGTEEESKPVTKPTVDSILTELFKRDNWSRGNSGAEFDNVDFEMNVFTYIDPKTQEQRTCYLLYADNKGPKVKDYITKHYKTSENNILVINKNTVTKEDSREILRDYVNYIYKLETNSNDELVTDDKINNLKLNDDHTYISSGKE
ncbi:MAG: type II secretion system protein [Anaerostipes sp.]|nr:type II secretion system protein [Anaerostipes sp.]